MSNNIIGEAGPPEICRHCFDIFFPRVQNHECPEIFKMFEELEKQYMTTTEKANQQETKEIVEHLDQYVWYNMPTELHPGVKAKSGQVLTALVYILVDKGLLSLDDVKRITKG